MVCYANYVGWFCRYDKRSFRQNNYDSFAARQFVENKIQLGIYGFNYKFAMIISMFLQAYRFAAEPLFFKNAEKEDNKQMLAKTMKFYTISVCFIFLTITLFMPLIQFSFSKYSPSSATYFEGVGIVPILLMANIFLRHLF
jgi:O-antigen/teichoic acid export membrane protein